MKILVISDKESPYIWDYFDYENFKDIDLVLSCGDLDPKYLSFIVTLLNIPVYYIHGNHDCKYEKKPPLGCECIEDKVITYKGLRIMGLGGSYRYSYGDHQYTEHEMFKRLKQLRKRLYELNGVDIVITHAAPKSDSNLDDLPHRGFQTFTDIIYHYRPSYLLHGHDHFNYSHKAKRLKTMEDTTIINGYGYYIFEYEPNNVTYKRKIKHLLPFYSISEKGEKDQ